MSRSLQCTCCGERDEEYDRCGCVSLSDCCGVCPAHGGHRQECSEYVPGCESCGEPTHDVCPFTDGVALCAKPVCGTTECLREHYEYREHDKHDPIPGCYGCLGTGYVKWAGVPPETECACRWAQEG